MSLVNEAKKEQPKFNKNSFNEKGTMALKLKTNRMRISKNGITSFYFDGKTPVAYSELNKGL